MPEAPRPFAEKRAHDSHAARARAIVDSLRATEPGSAEVFDAFWELDALPVDDVRAALAGWVGPLPLDALDDAVRRVHGLPPRPLRLRALSSATDADVLDLGPVAEAQLRIAGTTWDGADLAAEIGSMEGEGSFAGTLERRVLADADAPGDAPLFDVVLLGEGAGVVFAAGGTKVVALIAYRRVETKDARVRVAIEAALAEPEVGAAEEPAPPSGVKAVALEEPGAPPPVATFEESPPIATFEESPPIATFEESPPVATIEEPVPAATVTKAKAKKSAAKKTVAKKGAPKKAAAKKASATKAGAKKASAKKTPAKKGSAKKTAAKKGPAKKATAAGKVAAKKAGAKKKTAAKKKR